jgi:uncharacterized protein (TIGR03437 family)
VIGGKAPYTWTASGLPAGVSLDSATGAFSGTAGTPGNYSFSIQVSDSETPAITKTLGVTYSVLGIATSALPQASTTTAYAANVTGLGGTPPYSFSATGLPLGLSLSSSGSFSGTPQAVGNFTVVVKVSDVSLLSSSSTFLLVVTGPPSPLTVSGGALANGAVAAAYLASVRATGGAPPYSWSVLGGALPRGVSVSGAGIVQGVPTAPGVYSFTAEATDSSGATASATYTLTISPAPLTLSLGALPNGIAGADYPVQILTVSGGVAPYAAAITTGSLPAGLTLSGLQIVESSVPSTPGTYAFTITVTDSTGQTASGAGSILINPMSANLVLSQTNVAFSLVAGASGVPSPASVTVASSLVATILNDSFSVSPAASWLDVSSGPTTPAAIAIAIDPTAPSLPASTTPYTTTINVSCAAPSPCAGSVQTIDVSLVVSAPPPQLTVGSGLLSFGASSANPVSSSQSLGLQNTGGGVITVYSITAADAWVSVSNPPSSLTAGPSQTAIVTVIPAGLASGYYRSTITVDSSAGLATVPVTLIISQDLTLTLGPSGSQFSAPAGSSPGNSTGSFSVSVTGAGAANWNASVLTGASWLVLTSAAGSSTESSAATAGFSLNASAISSLAPATYYGTIQVTSGDVVNSPQDYQVVLDITPAAAPTVTALNTAGLVFTSSFAGSTSPQSVAVYSSSAAPTAYQASSATTDGANWLSVSPATGTASAGSPASSSVSVNVAGLAPGVYSGGVSYASSSDGVRTVNVSLLVLPAGTAVASSITSFPPAGANAAICTPKRLIATQTGLYGNFAQLAGLPAPVSIKLIDDCGAAVTGAGVIATFSNGDPPLMLQALDSTSGNYSGTWTPQTSAPQVSVTATAMEPPLPAATATVTGIVMANNAPILSQNGVVHVFNRLVGAGLAPGEIVEIYGDNLASQTVTDMAVPLPTVLAGTSVSIGNIPAPLFYVSPVQIDAQIPWTLTPGNQYQIQVNANGAVSTPGSVTIVPAAPGIAAAASGLALAQHNADFSSVTESSPARPGEYVVLYLAGLGATDTVVATGAAAPSSPLIHPLISPTLTLDGSSVPIAFVGLVPGYVGLYQIDVQIPANAPNGDLLLSVGQPGAVASNVTILPVQQ